MLIALLIFLGTFLGGSTTLESRVSDAIGDEARQKAALAVVERMTKIQADLAQQLNSSAEELRRVHEQVGMTREDYLEALAPIEKIRRETTQGLFAARAELREILTAEEWSEVFPGLDD